jgi:universal stress protein E
MQQCSGRSHAAMVSATSGPTATSHSPSVPLIESGIAPRRRTPYLQGLECVPDDTTNACPDPQVPRKLAAAVAQKRVLCATDLSPRSQRAVGRAALLANQLDAQLVLLHVMEPGQNIDQSRYAGEQMAQQLKSTGLPARREPGIELRAGAYIQTIAAVAKETHADLIVIGSQRRKPLAPLIGTTAEQITELSDRPVLIVSRERQEPYGAVLMAAELSDASVRIVKIAALLRFLDAKSVSVIHGFESPYRGPLYAQGFDARAETRNMEEWERAAQARLLRKLDAAGVESSRFRLVFQQTRPIRAMQRLVRCVQPDLLIVGTQDRSVLSRLMRGGAANDILRRIECDTLVASPGIESAGYCAELELHQNSLRSCL